MGGFIVGFFSSAKRTCSCCQKEVKSKNTVELADGNFICNQCFERVSKDFFFSPTYDTIEKVKKIIDYMVYSNTELKPIFKPDYGNGYYGIEVDPVNGLIKLGNTEWFFKLSDIQDFDVKFVPKEYSQGLSLKKCKVIGDIVFEATVKESDTVPLAFYNGTLMFDQKVTGRFDSIASTNITVDNPPDMDRFWNTFHNMSIVRL